MSKKYGVDLPSTLERSPAKAQRTYAKTLRSAEQAYGSGERAGRVAYAALKHGFEKVGDHWEAKAHKGPSDPRAARSGAAARRGEGATYGGVDLMGHSRQDLYERARQLDIPGRASMNKSQLAQAIAQRQR
ncbi:ChaB family protein [Caldimonas brevitalea]|uniref:Cation transport regulator ChaB n=1 Tax=Caldimonas brevitalea TaxID=413882 RepID=A0A0G3BLF2_9BURK|nr:ChaB family protein [Caldimonas brevitalea]AKJ27355.1 cation transport regulator ChaB [Caldimonas brevitalea]